MNKQVLKSPGFWIAMISAIVGQLLTSGVVLAGTAPYQVLGFVLTLAGVLTGHQVTQMAGAPAVPVASTPPAQPPAAN